MFVFDRVESLGVINETHILIYLFLYRTLYNVQWISIAFLDSLSGKNRTVSMMSHEVSCLSLFIRTYPYLSVLIRTYPMLLTFCCSTYFQNYDQDGFFQGPGAFFINMAFSTYSISIHVIGVSSIFVSINDIYIDGEIPKTSNSKFLKNLFFIEINT